MKVTLTIISLHFSWLSYSQKEVLDTTAFFDNRPIFPYYHPSQPSADKDFYLLKKDFEKAINVQTNFDGIITIVFLINYKGETGFYRTQLVDLDYQPLQQTKNNSELCLQILSAVKNIRSWKPAKDDSAKEVNSRKFYSFKFNKGKLVEILPK